MGKTQTFIAGASIAFGLPFLLIELITIIIDPEHLAAHTDFYGATYMTLYILGGALSGALVARRFERENMVRAGVITGALAFMLGQIVYYIFFGAGALGNTYTMFANIGGCLAGALYTRQNRKKEEEKKDEPESLS